MAPFVGSRPLASSSGRCVLRNLKCRPVDVFGPGTGLGGWAGNLRPIHTRGRRHEHCCPVTTITLRNIDETTVKFCYNMILQVQGSIIYLWGRSGQLEGVLDVV